MLEEINYPFVKDVNLEEYFTYNFGKSYKLFFGNKHFQFVIHLLLNEKFTIVAAKVPSITTLRDLISKNFPN